MAKKRGRPRIEDPRIHLPAVTVRQSTIEKFIAFSRQNSRFTLSHHVEKALFEYMEKHNKQRLKVTL